jgi:hypothetical protein
MHRRFVAWSAQLQPQDIGIPTATISELTHQFSSPEFKRFNPTFASVPAEECAAIYIHTAQDYDLVSPLTGESTPAYRLVNKLLRDASTATGQENRALDEAVNELLPYISTVTSGINRLIDAAPYSGRVFRGLRLTADQVENFKRLCDSGGTYVDPSFMSTTTDREAAQAFEPGTPNNTGLEIEVLRGAYVNPISQAQSEEEILLPPGRSFKVLNVQEHVSRNIDSETKFTIRLRQVGH